MRAPSIVESLSEAIEPPEAQDWYTYLLSAEDEERAEIIQDLADWFGVSDRTAQRWVKYLLDEPGQKRQPPAGVIEYLQERAPEGEIDYPEEIEVEVSGRICVSDDCRDRTTTIALYDDEAREFVDYALKKGERAALGYLFPRGGRRGASNGIAGASVGPREDGKESYFDVRTL